MKITIVGTGYVGLVTGACLADVGHDVMCLDINTKKIQNLKKGSIPIYEEGLEKIVKNNIDKKKLSFSSSYSEACKFSDIIFIAVDTPPKKNGDADLSRIDDFCNSIVPHMKSDKIFIEKSTVPVGTSDYIYKKTNKLLKDNNKNYSVIVVSNPEFLKEGTAIDDFMKPDRIIVGIDNQEVKPVFDEIYKPFNRKYNKILYMSIRAAELTKYASNALLATKISFINEISLLADKLNIDIDEVRNGIGLDKRIGPEFLYPGCGYGGSCFPKDISALRSMFKISRTKSMLLDAVKTVNDNQKVYLIKKISKHFKNNLKNKTIAVWGLTFKPKTDDIRFAPSIDMITKLILMGAKIQAYDPIGSLKHIFKKNYSEHNTGLQALKNSSALLICTEWKEFWSLNPKDFNKHMKESCIFDGRNIYSPSKMSEHGIIYYGIGRGHNKS
tara:strand:+ start:728 stop:2050 length:1323 start_codon:yes stop_codon:yes gene_type:complete